MNPRIRIQTWVFAAVIAAICGLKLPAFADEAPATSSPAAAPAGTPLPKTASKADQPQKPEPTADEQARAEQEKAAQALTKVHVVRGSLFSAGEAPTSSTEDQHARSAPVMDYGSVTPMEPKKFRKHDIITVVVQEESSATSTSKSDSQKQQDFDLALQQFLKLSLSNLAVSSSTNSGTLPEVKFKYNNNRQNAADQQRTDTATLRISATIVDVKPNGTLVIEATKQIKMDKEVQHMTLSGTCRAEDVAVDNTVLSTQLADLKLEKNTTGEVRDGVKRGWLNGLIDKYNPF